MKKHRILGLLIASTLVLGSTYQPPVRNTVHADQDGETDEEIQKKKEEAQQNKKNAEAKLSNLKTEKDELQESLQKLDDKIAEYQGNIDKLKAEQNKLRVQNAIAENNLQNAYIAEKNQHENMNQRIQYAYENGQVSTLDAIISSKDYSSMNNQEEYVNQVSNYDKDQFKRLQEIEKSIKTNKETIVQNLSKITEIVNKTASEQQSLKTAQDEKLAALKKANLDINSTNIDIETYERMEAEMDAELSNRAAAAEAEIERRIAAAQAQAAQPAPEPVTEAPTEAPTEAVTEATGEGEGEGEGEGGSGEEVTEEPATEAATEAPAPIEQPTYAPVETVNEYNGSGFIWPVPSHSISSYYGGRNTGIPGASTDHKGIDIDAAMGTPVVAVADGMVAICDDWGSGGNVVAIRHNSGLWTCYMHLSYWTVSPYTNVKAGDVIGYSGMTGVASGPHLHFAVSLGIPRRENYVNPLGYLP